MEDYWKLEDLGDIKDFKGFNIPSDILKIPANATIRSVMSLINDDKYNVNMIELASWVIFDAKKRLLIISDINMGRMICALIKARRPILLSELVYHLDNYDIVKEFKSEIMKGYSGSDNWINYTEKSAIREIVVELDWLKSEYLDINKKVPQWVLDKYPTNGKNYQWE